MSEIKFAVRVDRARKGGGSALMFFNLNIGYTKGGEFTPLVVGTDFVLQNKRAGGYFFKGPSKQRIRNGQPVKKDGFNVYDEMVKLYAEEADGKYALTTAASALKENILNQAVKAYEELGANETSNAQRGGAKASAATSTGAGKGGDIFGGDGSEEELPF